MSETSPPSPSQPGGLPGSKRDDKPDFRVIRSAPPAETGPSLAPMILLVAVIGLGVGGYLYTQRAETKAGAGTTTTATAGPGGGTTATATEATGPASPAPDFVMDKILFYETEGQYDRALSYAEEKLVEWPNAPELKGRVKQLRARLGLDGADNPDEGLRQIASRITARQYPESIEKLNAMIDGGKLSEPQSARAYFLRATCHANLQNVMEARNDAQAAEQLGHSAEECAKLREQFGL